MATIRQQRNAIEGLLSKRPKLIGHVPAEPTPRNLAFRLDENGVTLHFLGVSRPTEAFGFNTKSIAVFGTTRARKKPAREEWQHLLDCRGAVLLSKVRVVEGKTAKEQVTLLEPVPPKTTETPTRVTWHFRQTRKTATYPLLITG